MEATAPTLEHLVVDAGPIIKGERLEKLATNFWTVPEVIAEIRDSKSRERLQNLPYELKTLEPDAKSMKAVSDFAKQTGDLQAISFNDLKVLALTYMLEAQNNGIAHLRTEPKQHKKKNKKKKQATAPLKKTAATAVPTTLPKQREQKHPEWQSNWEDATPPLPTTGPVTTTTSASSTLHALYITSETFQGARTGYVFKCGPQGNGYYADSHTDDVPAAPTTTAVSLVPSVTATPTATPAPKSKPTSKPTSSWASIAAAAADVKEVTFVPPPKIVTLETLPASDDFKTSLSGEDYFGVSANTTATATMNGEGSNKTQKATSRILASGVSTMGNMGTGSQQVADEDDGEGWVNGSNFQTAVASVWGKGGKSTNESTKTLASAGCITTDFAMQNVLLQMGLKLLAIDGRIVKRVKQWVLKCDACFFITPKMTGSTFCERCGSNAMCRLSVRVQSNGKVEYGYNPYRKISTRGQRYSIPARKGGRDGQGLILRADQIKMGTWDIKSKEKNRLKSQFGEDITGSLGMDLKTVGGNLQAGFGRRNPNTQKGRERRGKKGLKHQKNKRFNPYRTSSK